jgi:hypothetical protein
MMHGYTAFWLPTLVSALFVFIAQAILQMATKWHHSDYGLLPDEEAFRAAVKPLSIPPGDYTVPRFGGGDMRSPEFVRKNEEGPRVMMTVLPNGVTGIGGMLLWQFLYLLFVSWFAGHFAFRVLGPGAGDYDIIHTVWGITFAAHGLALWPLTIWYRRSLRTTLKANVDALLFAVITALTFVWLWPR